MENVYAFGQSFERLQPIASVYILKNYSAVSVCCVNDETYMNGLKLNGFSRFIKKITIPMSRIDNNRLRYIETNYSQWLKQIHLISVILPVDLKTASINRVFYNVEILEINKCTLNGDLYENLLEFCPNVKRLCLRYSDSVTDMKNRWLTQKYSNIEHLEWLKLKNEMPIDQLYGFFKRNSHIQSFATTASFLWNQRHSFPKNLELDNLAVMINYSSRSLAYLVLDLLVAFEKSNFYKHLHLYIVGLDTSKYLIHRLAQLNNLTNICIKNYDSRISFVPLTNVKEVMINFCTNFTDLRPLAQDLSNIQRVYLWKAKLQHIVPFIRYSNKLQTIAILSSDDDNKDEQFTWSLRKLDEAREKLKRPRKVTIYVEEKIFLTIKWTTNNQTFKFIEIRRAESHDRLHHFEY